MKPNRWQAIAPSAYPWEQEALNYLSQNLPDHEPFRGWSNFEFIADDGTINEVDALILGPAGFYLVEIKSMPGEISGDTHSWTWRQDGRSPYTDDNPLFLANRKARKLASLLRRQKEFNRLRLPFVEAVVFCSATNNRLKLPESLGQKVFIRDHGMPPKSGIIEAVTRPRSGDTQFVIDAPMARAIGRALDQAGIRPANRSRRVSDYTLDKIIYEHPQGTFQDWLGKHATLKGDVAMVRIYPRAHGQTADEQAFAARAAEREYALLQPLEHVGILQVRTHTTHESGPALVFRFSETFVGRNVNQWICDVARERFEIHASADDLRVKLETSVERVRDLIAVLRTMPTATPTGESFVAKFSDLLPEAERDALVLCRAYRQPDIQQFVARIRRLS